MRAHERAIVRYYDSCWVSRLQAGHNAGSRAMHFGTYRRGSSDDHETAKLETNVELERWIGRSPHERLHVLDAGCGIGGTAVHLATRNPGWTVYGLNLGRAQLAMAAELARQRQVARRVRLLRGSFDDPPLAPASIDVAFFVESLCHSPDPERTLRRLREVLRDGARIVVLDLARTARPLEECGAGRFYADVCDGFCIPGYFDRPLATSLQSAGYEDVVEHDHTELVMPGIVRSGSRARARLASGVYLPALERAHLRTCAAIEELVRSGHLSYRVVVATRSRA